MFNTLTLVFYTYIFKRLEHKNYKFLADIFTRSKMEIPVDTILINKEISKIGHLNYKGLSLYNLTDQK